MTSKSEGATTEILDFVQNDGFERGCARMTSKNKGMTSKNKGMTSKNKGMTSKNKGMTSKKIL
jgi:hypothetical protein